MDRGIWATWYDLEKDGGSESEFLDWMHGEYLPAIRTRPGIAWVAHYRGEGAEGANMQTMRGHLGRCDDPAVGTGSQYLMLVGAPEPAIFSAPNIVAEEVAETGRIRAMLDRRLNLRTNIFSEFARVDGPEIGTRPAGTTPGPAIQMGSFRIHSIEDEFDLCAWYAQHRLPAIARLKGSIAARTMLSAAGWAKFSVLYEFTSLKERLENFENKHEALGLSEKEWTHRVHHYTRHVPGSPTVGERIWPPVGVA